MDEAAFRYAASRRKELLRSLGSGQDGSVWLDSDRHAIKAFERDRAFRAELQCYHRLRERSITRLNGFAIPTLLGFSRDFRVIEMDLVAPPSLLDFGKAYVDNPPDYVSDPIKMRQWREEGRERFDRH